jgi:hypothetical protein
MNSDSVGMNLILFSNEVHETQVRIQRRVSKIVFHEFISDPFSRGSAVNPENLLVEASVYLFSRLGKFSFQAAVSFMDILSVDLVPRREITSSTFQN